MDLKDVVTGLRIDGVVGDQPATVLAVTRHGSEAIQVTYETSDGGLDKRILYRSDAEQLAAHVAEGRPFDADPAEFRIAAEAQRIQLAGWFDPMLAVSTSAIQPLPHQIRAVYHHLLEKAPLSFLLADDPGAGKTIMAGLYIKELAAHQAGCLGSTLPTGHPALELVPVEQGEERGEVLVLARVRRRRHQQEVPGALPKALAEQEPLGLLQLVTEVVRAHPVGLVDDDQVPLGLGQLSHQQVVAG